MAIFQTRIWHHKTNIFFLWNKKTIAVTGHSDLLSLRPSRKQVGEKQTAMSAYSLLLLTEASPVFVCYLGIAGRVFFSPAFRLLTLPLSVTSQSLCCMKRLLCVRHQLNTRGIERLEKLLVNCQEILCYRNNRGKLMLV